MIRSVMQTPSACAVSTNLVPPAFAQSPFFERQLDEAGINVEKLCRYTYGIRRLRFLERLGEAARSPQGMLFWLFTLV